MAWIGLSQGVDAYQLTAALLAVHLPSSLVSLLYRHTTVIPTNIGTHRQCLRKLERIINNARVNIGMLLELFAQACIPR